MSSAVQKSAVAANLRKIALMLILTAAAGFLTSMLGDPKVILGDPACVFTAKNQIITVATFVCIISATLLFWDMRLAVAFIGMSFMLAMNVAPLDKMMEQSELHIILFLVGMMTLVGVLKDLGLFTWLIQAILNQKNMSGRRFMIILILLSGIMASLVDEVTSIVFVLALVFQVCDTLKIRPMRFVLVSVMATNIGSTGTMLGNPVGLLIGTKMELSFGSFIEHAFPIMFVSLLVTLAILMLWMRKDIAQFDERLKSRRDTSNLGLGPLVKIPHVLGLAIFFCALVFIASHSWMEHKLGLEHNTMLIVAPLTIAGILMIYRHKRARHYIEAEVEWWTLLFFLVLFAVAGSLETTGVSKTIVERFKPADGAPPNPMILTPLIVAITAIGSAFVDNIVFVAAFIPIVKELIPEGVSTEHPYTWAMLFGSCFGGNITAIGSTANIVALGMMGKHYGIHTTFKEWIKIGAVVGIITCAVATGMILIFYK